MNWISAHRYLLEWWPTLLSALILSVSIFSTLHIVLYKREARSAVAWVGLVWLAPLIGASLYTLFGINRIQRRAKALRGGEAHMPLPALPTCSMDVLSQDLPSDHLLALARLGDRLNQAALTAGNHVELLNGGDVAYPAMIEAMDGAIRSVHLSTYIFDNDRAGRLFLQSLQRAKQRGVQVRVLIDDVGTRYSFPPMHRVLRKAGVRVARFMPTYLPWRIPYVNLRNHRKILVVDDDIGFTGGMNIREGSMLSLDPKHPIQDLHARLTGPVVTHLQRAFLEDWQFTTGEQVALLPCNPTVKGSVFARGIIDGPDENFDAIRLSILGALASAQKQVSVMTPYFLPDDPIIAALGVAARRGVAVDVVLPEKNNLAMVHWATMATVWQVLLHGCRIWLSPPPFDHTKLMVVDGAWTLLGSANWDPRSLQLNFEFNVECFDRNLAHQAQSIASERIAASQQLTLEQVDNRSLHVRVRDGVARLFSPYL